MSVATMRWEIENEVENLKDITHQLAKKSIEVSPRQEIVFTGSGDSWAASLFAKELDKDRANAEDPSELLASIRQARRKQLVIISISGRTWANIELAKTARKAKIKTIAVTANAVSSLAKNCDDSIVLGYPQRALLTSGTTSFTASLLACSKILRGLPSDLELNQATATGAAIWARKIRLRSEGKCIFVGSGSDRALAEYGACKIQEVLGSTAIGTFPEQVGHALLFSLNPSSDTIVCIDTVGSVAVKRLHDRLSKAGLRVYTVAVSGRDTLSKSIAASLYLQYLALTNAERMGLRECAFIRNKPLLKLSNDLIYQTADRSGPIDKR